ncbi:MAG: hypothetical protein KKH83_03960, partial [Candidatus Margulisbacteria bacterium]|nr:hypothetical protein [Candidatus Margulisiibacteriota bacterium]
MSVLANILAMGRSLYGGCGGNPLQGTDGDAGEQDLQALEDAQAQDDVIPMEMRDIPADIILRDVPRPDIKKVDVVDEDLMSVDEGVGVWDVSEVGVRDAGEAGVQDAGLEVTQIDVVQADLPQTDIAQSDRASVDISQQDVSVGDAGEVGVRDAVLDVEPDAMPDTVPVDVVDLQRTDRITIDRARPDITPIEISDIPGDSDDAQDSALDAENISDMGVDING